MNVLFVAPRYHTNQVPFVRALLEAGHEVRFDVVHAGVTEDHTLIQPTVVAPARLAQWLQRRRAPTNLARDHADHTFPSLVAYFRRLKAVAPDVVVIRDPNRPFSAVAAVAARSLGIRVVLYTQGEVHAPPDRRKWLMRDLMLRGLRAEWYSPVPGDASRPRVHPRVHFLPLAADREREVKADWFRDDAVHVLAVGKFTPGKNHLLLLEALDAVHRTHRVRLTLVGEVSTPEHVAHHAEVLAAVARTGMSGDVTVMTNVPFSRMAAVYLRHDVFVLPSRNEPLGVSVLEAMAHGLPVVCSSTNGARWYVEHGRSGRVFASDDLDDLIANLSVVGDRAELQAYGARGRELVETVHDPRAIVAAFENIVGEIPSRGRARSDR